MPISCLGEILQSPGTSLIHYGSLSELSAILTYVYTSGCIASSVSFTPPTNCQTVIAVAAVIADSTRLERSTLSGAVRVFIDLINRYLVIVVRQLLMMDCDVPSIVAPCCLYLSATAVNVTATATSTVMNYTPYSN